jgi:putative ABC transport system permease protein
MWLRRRGDFERDLSDELAFHLERRTDDLVARGLTRDAARAQARREFGNPAAWAEHCRDARGWRLLDELRQDVRFAWRGIMRRRLTAAIAVFTLTFGIGISSGVFTMLSAAMLRPQVADDPDSFVRLYTASTADLSRPRPFAQTTLEQYLALRERLSTIQPLAASRNFGASIAGGTSQRVLLASCNLFDAYGVRRAALGRLLLDTDCARAERVVVLANDIWRRRFDADAAVIGRMVDVAGVPMTVVGVAPEGSAPDGGAAWLPYTLRGTFNVGRDMRAGSDGQDRWLNLAGRLSPGVTLAQAQAEATVAAAALDALHPAQRTSLKVTDGALLHDPNVRGNVIGVLTLLMGALTGLVLIVCANVATLLLSQAAARREEIAIRLAMGAGRPRLVRMLLTETLTLAGCAGVASYFVARAVPGVLLYWMTDRPPVFPMTPDWRVFAYLAASVGLAGVAAGLTPALESMRVDIVTSIKGQRSLVGPRSHPRTPGVLMAVQIAFGFVLLTGAALFIVTHYQTITRDPGYESHAVLMPRVTYRQTPKSPAAPGPSAMREVLAAIPSTRGIAFAATAPGFEAATADAFADGVTVNVETNEISPGFFDVLDLPIARGRALDRSDAPCQGHGCAVVVSEALARRLFATGDAVGREVRLGAETLRIVGVAADTSAHVRGRPDPPVVYLPWTEDGRAYQALVRFDGDTARFAASAARALRDRFSGASVDVHTLRWPLDGWIDEIGGVGRLVVALGLASALLAAMGVFGVVSFAVSRREREFGIRIALGATRAQIYATVLRTGARPIAAGLTAGALLALLSAAGFARVLATVQFTIAPFDPRLYVIAGVPLILVIGAALIVPARRATSVDPLRALKYE